jgi:hypothetical protein
MTLLPWSLALPDRKNVASDNPKVTKGPLCACQALPLRRLRSYAMAVVVLGLPYASASEAESLTTCGLVSWHAMSLDVVAPCFQAQH